jgi:hypothetical protein
MGQDILWLRYQRSPYYLNIFIGGGRMETLEEEISDDETNCI